MTLRRATLSLILLLSLLLNASQGQVQSQRAAGVPGNPSEVGYLDLHKRHPDGPEGPVEFSQGYSVVQGLEALDRIRGFLDSFNKLTDRVRDQIPDSDLRAAGNTSRSMQSLGFHNIPLGVERTLLKQDYLLKQVQYELAQLKRGRGEISAPDLDRARAAYASATKQFQMFWDAKLPTD